MQVHQHLCMWSSTKLTLAYLCASQLREYGGRRVGTSSPAHMSYTKFSYVLNSMHAGHEANPTLLYLPWHKFLGLEEDN